jgi:putative DNA primase/helicase
VVDGNGEIMRRAKETAKSIGDEAALAEDAAFATALKSHAKKSQSRPRLEAMINLAQSEVPIAPEALDRDGHLLNLGNGTLDLRSGKLRSHKGRATRYPQLG